MKIISEATLPAFKLKEIIDLDTDNYHIKLLNKYLELYGELGYLEQKLEKLVGSEALTKILDILPNNEPLINLVLSYYGESADPKEILKIISKQ